MVWKRADSQHMSFRTYTYGRDGGRWGPERLVGGGGGTSTSPTVGCSKYNTFWVAWKGINPDTNMWYTKTTDGGETWQTQQVVGGGGTTNTRPSLVATEYMYNPTPLFAESVFVAWKGIDDQRIYYSNLDTKDSPNWTPQAVVGGEDVRYRTSVPPTLSYDFAPAGSRTPGVVWRGADDGRIRSATMQEGGAVSPPVFVAGGNAVTDEAPGASADRVPDHADGDGMVLWKSTSDTGNPTGVWRRAPGTGDTPERFPQIGGATYAPAYAFLEYRDFSGGKRLELAVWKGVPGDTRMFFTTKEY